MIGSRTGATKRIADEEPRAVFTHCYRHSLNLTASDTEKSKLMKDALDTTHEMTKLITFSPQCDAIFHALKATLKESALFVTFNQNRSNDSKHECKGCVVR